MISELSLLLAPAFWAMRKVSTWDYFFLFWCLLFCRNGVRSFRNFICVSSFSIFFFVLLSFRVSSSFFLLHWPFGSRSSFVFYSVCLSWAFVCWGRWGDQADPSVVTQDRLSTRSAYFLWKRGWGLGVLHADPCVVTLDRLNTRSSSFSCFFPFFLFV